LSSDLLLRLICKQDSQHVDPFDTLRIISQVLAILIAVGGVPAFISRKWIGA